MDLQNLHRSQATATAPEPQKAIEQVASMLVGKISMANELSLRLQRLEARLTGGSRVPPVSGKDQATGQGPQMTGHLVVLQQRIEDIDTILTGCHETMNRLEQIA